MNYFKMLPLLILGLLSFHEISFCQTEGKPLILQEITWTDVRDYLTTSDMVMIPLGSTEQHGPHLPLGTDYILSLDVSKEISAKTGVILAPVLCAGYSIYHSGFPGTLSISPETMQQALFEAAQSLIKHGFRRIMIFNYHGGNEVAQANLIHRINHETEATAIAIGLGSSVIKLDELDSLDYHAGVDETSMMLYSEPGMVKMERATKPSLHFTNQVEELMKLSKTKPQMMSVWEAMLGVPASTNKGGASNEISNNGIWTLKDPRTANAERGKKTIQRVIDQAVDFINAWKQIKSK